MRLLAWGGQANWPFGELIPNGYDMIMADPPWLYNLFSEKGENKSAQRHYKCLPTEEIMQFPVLDLAMDNCMLLMYCTNPMIRDAFRVMEAWGFEFKTMGVWRKMTKNGHIHFGTGYILRSSHEPVLIGSRGQPKAAKNVRSIFDGLTREHSRKPEEGFTWAERLMPKATSRLELFSRNNRPGWTSWGDEAGKFDERILDGGRSVDEDDAVGVDGASLGDGIATWAGSGRLGL